MTDALSRLTSALADCYTIFLLPTSFMTEPPDSILL